MEHRHPPTKKHPAHKWLPLAALAILGLWLLGSHVFKLSPSPVGFYIGVLAFVAGVVTIWPPEENWAKAAWLLVFGGFLILEITTLYQQRSEDTATIAKNRAVEDN